MKEFINSVFEDQNGQKSSKRVIAFLAFMCLAIAFLISMFKEIMLPVFMWDSMMYIVAGGIGVTTIEKFTKR
jgi:hypothetical protein